MAARKLPRQRPTRPPRAGRDPRWPPRAALTFAHDLYPPAALREALAAFRTVCTLVAEPGRGATRIRLRSGTLRDLLEFGNYVLARSLQMRRRTSSGSTNNGYSSDEL